MESLPKSVVVVGGGYIGVECAQILNSYGVKTTLIVRSGLLSFVDKDVTEVLTKEVKNSGINLHLRTTHQRVEKLADGSLRVFIKEEGGEETSVDTECVLMAIGRPPNTSSLQLQNTKVELEPQGFVKVDEFQNTTQKGVYAVGDVTNAPALTPVAIRAGRILSERLFNGRETLKTNNENVATVVFSHPPIGVIGMSESQAVSQFGREAVVGYKSSFGNMFYGLTPADAGLHKPQSFFKLICRKEQRESGKVVERVVGVHGIGRGIDEMMQGFSVAVNMGATKQDFDNSIAIHPTASEEFVLMDTQYE